MGPNKPGDKDYAGFVEMTKKHYNSILSEIVQRYKFYTFFQELSESIATCNYVPPLRSITKYCKLTPHWMLCNN